MKNWYLYILRCGDGSLYTGITPDVAKRLAAHRAGKGAKYTRGRQPLELVYLENCGEHSSALRRELEVKALTRPEKQALIGDNTMLLSQFDPAPQAVINPDFIHKPVENFPDTVVSVFSHTLFASLVEALDGKQIAETHDVDGVWPVYEVTYREKRLAMYKARLGAPACVGDFEDVIAMGARRIILLGNCGVLDRKVQDCGIIIPTKAIRDEGTSYHYAPPSDTIAVNKKYIPQFISVLEEHGYPYVTGTTWTTDAFYRETRAKVEARKQMGAICVEMECAAMQALCDFRGVEFFQFFYAGDNLDHSAWEPRSLSGTSRLDDKQKIALLAFELASRI